jgi:hypothetical protein
LIESRILHPCTQRLLCDNGCRAIFDKHKVESWNQDQIILTGFHDPRTNLWVIPLQPKVTISP